MTDKTKTTITIVVLIVSAFFPILMPLGILFVWTWTDWSRGVKLLLTVPYTIMVSVACLVLSYLFLFRPFQVEGDSMFPSFQENEYIMTKVYSLRDLGRSDTVIYNSVQQNGVMMFGRVIGLPGDDIRLNSGVIYVNGEELSEDAYLNKSTKTMAGSFLIEDKTVNVPQDSYFLLVDNREKGADSRDVGFILQQDVVGEALFCYWNCK